MVAEVELDPQRPGYDLRSLCIRIRSILRQMGFGNAEGKYPSSFITLEGSLINPLGADFYNLMNQFPHALMHEGQRRTIPMSLVYIFVSICRRLGIRASPTNFPGKVLCHIAPVNPKEHEMLFDLCSDAPPFVFTSHNPVQMLADVGLPSDARVDLIRPCDVGTILHRAAANIIVSVRWNQRRMAATFSERYAWCSYAALCVFLLQSQDNQVFSHLIDSKPLDAFAVLTQVVCPALVQEARTSVLRHCSEIVQKDEEFAQTVWKRSEFRVQYFTGLVVKHSSYDYVGCIIGWHVRESDLG